MLFTNNVSFNNIYLYIIYNNNKKEDILKIFLYKYTVYNSAKNELSITKNV